jgi:hypothetical protein
MTYLAGEGIESIEISEKDHSGLVLAEVESPKISLYD